MGKKSLFSQLPPELTARFHELLSDDRYTQKQMVDYLNRYLEQLGHQPVITERVVQRQAVNYKGMGERLRRERDIAESMMAQISNKPNTAQSQLLSALLQSIAARVTMEMSENEELPAPKDIRELAQAKKIIDESNRITEQLIKQARLEAATVADSEAKKAGVSEETRAQIRKNILGMDDNG